MTALLQISDPHFGTEQAPVVDALRTLVEECRPEVVVMTGDVTQRATAAEFRLAAAFLASLASPVRLVLPGNHDIPLLNLPLRLLAPFARFRRVFGAELEPVHDDPALQLTCVNTVVRYWHKDGAIAGAAIDRVARRLAAADAGQLRVVVCHHPVLAARAEDEHNLLRGGDRAVRRWVDAGADLIVGGHIHLPYVRPLKQRYPDLKRDAWAVQAGTAVSTRIRAGIPNSVNLIRAGEDGHRPACTIERWDYRGAAGRFERIAAERLEPDRTAVNPGRADPAGAGSPEPARRRA
ncbi:MAG: metallophosphoesterase [Lautropia sp.]